MYYYFPIYINKRRLHYYKLQPVTAHMEYESRSFNFLINDSVDSPLLLSVDGNNPQLISSEGFNNNKKLSGYSFSISPAGEQDRIDALSTFIISIKMGLPSIKTDDTSLLISQGEMNDEEPGNRAKVLLDCTLNNEADGRRLTDFAVIISYIDDNGREYRDANTFHLHRTDELKTYALDFGSEASQIREDGMNMNIDIISSLKSTFGNPDKPIENYWQGDIGESLYYKSVFFVRRDTTQEAVNFGDAPQVDKKNAFITPLLSKTTPTLDYNQLVLLPNLKLMEIGGEAIYRYYSEEFVFHDDTHIDDGHNRTLGTAGLRDSILRLILGNFLHCILAKINTLDSNNVCLKMILLVPNVYYQSKIFKLVHDLYEDYRTIQNGNNPYVNCKGFEIQVVSESDASFFGVKNIPGLLQDDNKNLFLIIDAGKGTTDFSIIKQTDNYSRYNSLYRDGIPASGNVLTYAFYEALHNYLEFRGVNLNEYLRNAQKSQLLLFMDCLEEFKINYSENNNQLFDDTAGDVDSMNTLITFLQRQLRRGKQIPGCKEYVDRKVELLVQGIEDSMSHYMTETNKKYIQVVLTGRGFLFKPFRESVIDMLKKNEWLLENGKEVSLNGDDAKTQCLKGALLVETYRSVNKNSGLIGLPRLIKATNDTPRNEKKCFLKSLFSKRSFDLKDSFFYEGVSAAAQNVSIIIGGRRGTFGADDRNKRILFYVGDGFILQSGNQTQIIDERYLGYSDTKIQNLVFESLFPYYPGSIPDDGRMPRLHDADYYNHN